MLASGVVNITTVVRYGDAAPDTPKGNILVVGVNADGTLAGTATTDAAGKATLTIREGATVTAIYPEDAFIDNTITSYVGVKPNDNLTFGDHYFTPPTTIAGTAGLMTVNWPAFIGATQYLVYSPCGSNYVTGTTYSLPLQTYCQTATAPILVMAVDANYDIIATAYLPAAAFTVGATVNVAAGQWVAQTANSFVVSMSGLDPVVTAVRFNANAQFPQFTIGESDFPTPKAGAASAMLSIPMSAGALTYASAQLNRNGNFGEQTYFKRGASPIAFAPTALPWISDTSIISAFPPYRVVWLETASTYDAAVLDMSWQRSDGKITHYFQWRVILPPGVADFKLGTPPAELAALLPTVDDNVNHELRLVDLSSATSYDAARALPEWRLANVQSSVNAGDEPSAAITSDGEGFTFSD